VLCMGLVGHAVDRKVDNETRSVMSHKPSGHDE
jgi:hypothetical protein